MISTSPTAELAERLRAAAGAGLGDAVGPAVLAAAATALTSMMDVDDAAATRVAAHLEEHGGAAGVPVVGRPERLDALGATLLSGMVIAVAETRASGAPTPIAPSLAAMLGVGAVEDVPGDRALTALALGCEVQSRLAAHAGDAGERWDLTTVCGPVGAAVTAALSLDLSVHQLRTSMGIACAQLLGHRASAGTPISPFLIGKGAANGVHAALLARDGLTSAETVLEHPRGFFAVVALGDAPEAAPLTDGLGERWGWLDDALTERPTAPALTAALEPALGTDADGFVAALLALPDAGTVRELAEAGSRTEVAA